MHITKSLLLFLFIYRKNLVESADKSAGASPSPGTAPASTTGGSDQGLATSKGATTGSPYAITGTQKSGTTGQPSSQHSSQTSATSVTQPKSSPTSQSQTQSSSSSPSPKQSADIQSSQTSQKSSTPAARTGQGGAGTPVTTPPPSPASGTDDKSKASETTKKTGVDLCIKKNKEATDHFNYKKDNDVVTYTANGDYGFKLVKQKDTEIWKAKDDKGYARKVLLKGKGKSDKTVIVYMPIGTTEHFRKEGKGKPWNVVSFSANQPATQQASSSGGSEGWLDKIKGWCTSCCGKSESSKPDGSGKTGGSTHTSSDSGGRGSDGSGTKGHAPPANLNAGGQAGKTPSTNEGSGTPTSGRGSSTTPPANISSGSGSDGTGTRTGGRGTGTGGSTHTSSDGNGAKTGGSAQCGGGTHTSSDGSSHRGGTSSLQPAQNGSAHQTGKSQNTPTELDPSNYPKDIKLFKADPSDATKTKELETSEYKVQKLGGEHLYEFNDDANCTLIKRDNKDVWTYDSTKSNAKYPKGFSFETFVYIYFDGYTEVYGKSDNEWVLCVSIKIYINKPDLVDSGKLDLASIPVYFAST